MSRPFFVALAGLVVIAIAIGMSVWIHHRDDQPAPATAKASSSPAPAAANEGAPSFDIVRINAQGETVIAGRAQPKAEVVILDGDKEIGRVIADNRGEWVFVPDHPLPPGGRELSLEATNPDGTKHKSESPVVLVVPDRSKDKTASLAVKINTDGSIEVLQGPDAKDGSGSISIAGVRYDSLDRLSVTGKASNNSRVQIYVDDHLLSRTRADSQGRWHVAPKYPLHTGPHTIRADQLDNDGKVAARVEITFAPTGTLPPDGKLTVEPGNSLWRLARRAYGSGFEYLSIYQANKDQIRDPNQIYPGQVLALPPPKP